MSEKIYDVFISYRRDGGFGTAKHLNDLLCHDGYSVSFDINTLREGDFDKALLARIEQCNDFILIVDRHCFDKTLDNSVKPEQDWLRIELAYALKLKRNIIPILLPNSTFPDELPDDIKDVPRKNGPKYSKEYFDTFYGILKGMLHALPRYSDANSVASNKGNCANLKVRSNLDCVMYVDDEECANVKADKMEKVPLKAGEYMLKFESVENAADSITDDFNMPDMDKLYNVDLLTLKQEREQRERKDFEVYGVKFKMIYVEGGTFTMGATEEQEDDAYDRERPTHKVMLSDYYIGETVVTQELWKAVMREEPTYNGGWTKEYGNSLKCPAYRVSYEDITKKFIPKLNSLTGRKFRLPTEAEWEYAARGGKKSKRCKYSGSDDLDEVVWYIGNSEGKTHPVKGKKANELGLYDMSGNVWEWCNDWYGEYSSDDQPNPKGPDKGSDRVLRGGGWCNDAGRCRVSYRRCISPTFRGNYLGFRLVMCP